VPLGTQQQPDGTLVVDLSNDFFQATGDFQVRAVAQVVFTACALDGIDRVRLLVEGQPQEWPRGDGSLQSDPLTPYAYPDLNPSSQPDYPPPPSPGNTPTT
jgi:spore germination protein GerM